MPQSSPERIRDENEHRAAERLIHQFWLSHHQFSTIDTLESLISRIQCRQIKFSFSSSSSSSNFHVSVEDEEENEDDLSLPWV